MTGFDDEKESDANHHPDQKTPYSLVCADRKGFPIRPFTKAVISVGDSNQH